MKVKKIVKKDNERIVMKTTQSSKADASKALMADWWKADNEQQLSMDLCSTAAYLKTNQNYRQRQLAVDVRLYCGLSVYSYAGSTTAKMDRTKTLPDDRPTFNLIQSCGDTLVSRLTQNEPAPKFLTDGGDYKQRHVAQQLNQFVLGEFDQAKVYQKAPKMLRDGIAMGTGTLKVYEGDDEKVAVDRVLITDLFIDDNDALNGDPQQLIQLKLVDRSRLIAKNPKHAMKLLAAPQSYPDNTPDSGRTMTDQVMVVEAWRLASGKDQNAKGYVAGRHTITVAGTVLRDEPWHKVKFPFVFMNYSDPFLGFWGQGLATQLFGTQMALNRILYTISQAIQLVGVPRVFQENNSKVVSSHHNNQVGVIVKFTGTKPSYEVAPCNAPELYAERDKLIEYGQKQCGVSDMQATGEKPSGLDSGEAIRSFDDVNSDRFATISKAYDRVFIDLAYLMVEEAMDIAKKYGKYSTVYPNKDGTKEIDLPAIKFLQDPFVIQCFNESSLPRTPAGRIATVTEQVQAGMLTIKEGRRLMRFPDLEANERLDNSSEERIFKMLDGMVEDGKWATPDTFLDLDLATTLTVQYINLYFAANLEESKKDLLRRFFKMVQALKQAAMPPPVPAQAPTPQANPQPLPTSPLVPNAQPQAA